MAALCLAGFLLSPVETAWGIAVNSGADTPDGSPTNGVCESPCTLRAAVQTANASAGSGTITVPAGTYDRTTGGVDGADPAATGDLDVTGDLSITGAGAPTTIVDGRGLERVFDIAPGASVLISGVTITGGTATDGGEGATAGGGVRVGRFGSGSAGLTLRDVTVRANSAQKGAGVATDAVGSSLTLGFGGSVSIDSSLIKGNTAEYGAGVTNDGGGTMSITNSTVTDNHAVPARGQLFSTAGGVLQTNGGTITIDRSTVSFNTASEGGGVAELGGGTVAITNSTVSDNSTPAGQYEYGGGVLKDAEGGDVTISGSTIARNTASTGGGMQLLGNGGSVSIVNSTFSANRATERGGGIQAAGPGTLTLTNATMSGNVADAGAAALDNCVGPGCGTPPHSVTLRSTIIAGGPVNCSGPITSAGHNIDSANTCGFAATGDKANTDPAIGDKANTNPLLGALGDNGGPTATHALLDGSPAIDAGEVAACPATDQRGVGRPFGAGCDVGAFERAAVTTRTVRFSSATYATPEATPSVTITVERVGDLAGGTTVRYATAGGTAAGGLGGADYVPASGTLTFADGQASQTFSVQVLGDGVPEDDETFGVTLSEPSPDAAIGTPSSASVTIVDDDPVDTEITAAPSGPTNDPTPEFAFRAIPPPGATFDCWVDEGAPAPCSSPFSTSRLPDGQHTFSVRARRGDGVIDRSPATARFAVDTVAPTALVTLFPVPGQGAQLSGGGARYSGEVRVIVAGEDPAPGSGVSEERCSLDPLAPPVTYAELTQSCSLSTRAIGVHTVYAAARDVAGNAQAPVKVTFTILATPDTVITSGPSGPTWEKNPAFEFVSSLPGSTFRCRFDSEAFATCRDFYFPEPLQSGPHVFEVAAVSPAGVVDPTPARRAFSVNSTEVRRFACVIKPFVDPFSNSGSALGCKIDRMLEASACVQYVCKRITDTCPRGAQCTLEMRASWFDADTNINWGVVASTGYNLSAFDRPNSTRVCRTGLDSDRCYARASLSQLGDNQPVGLYCNSLYTSDTGAGERLGANYVRRLECDGDLTIKPAQALRPIVLDDFAQIYAPAAGKLEIFDGTVFAIPSSASAARRRVPAIKSARKTVKRAGPVTFKLKLSKGAKRTLARRNKLSLALRVTFTSRGGKAVTKTQKITLRKVVKPKVRPTRRG